MNSSNNISEVAKGLLSKVEENPTDWSIRKSVALELYEKGCFLEAADTVWNAPEMPSTDVDVAFAVKVVSRARPNRSIRLVYEVLRRNVGKAEQNMAIARAFNMVGLPMMASRFYGAAMAISSKYFDVGFEQQSLWFDDSGSLVEAWEKSSQDIKPPFSKPMAEFLGDSINLASLNDETPLASQATAAGTATPSVSKPAALSGKPTLSAAKTTAPTPVRPAVPVVKTPVSAPSPAAPAPATPPRTLPPAPASSVPAGASKPMLPPLKKSPPEGE